MVQRIQLRRGTAAEWAAANPVLGLGEPGVETDSGKMKLGDGSTAWNARPYASKGDKGEPGSPGMADDASVAQQVTSGTATKAALNATYVRPVKVSDLTLPVYAAHRVGANIAPEQTLEGFTLTAALDIPILDMDVWGSVEGVPFCVHDQTLDRTTTLTGNVSDRSAAELQLATVDPSTWHAPGWPNTKLLTMEDVLRRFGGRSVLSIEVKDTRAVVGANMVALLQKYGLTKSVIINSYSLAALAPFVAAGVECMFNNDTYATTPATLLAAGVTWMGASAYVTTDAQIADAISKGMKVCVYTVERHNQRAKYVGLGVHMIMGDDPAYVQGDPAKYRRKSTSFASQIWGHGIIDGRGSRTNNSINSSGEMVLAGTGSLEPSVLIGELSPVANPSGTYSITATVKLVSASTWAAVCFAVGSDVPFKQAGTTGYMVLIRNTGSLELFKVTDGSGGNALATGSTAAIAAGGTATLKVDVSPTGLTVTRTDAGPTSIVSSDTAYRGGYIHVSKQNAASEVRFLSLTVS